MKKWFLLCSVLLSFSLFADSVNFISKPMSAGKASLAENAYSISRLLGTANFSPELKLPVQLVYNSSIEKSGLFGFAWCSPQLESTAYYDKDGVLWVTPWGERIKFFSKYYSRNKDDLAEYAFYIESPNEGNSNSIQNTLFVLSGISIPLPENFSCYGYNHIINSSFFRRSSVAE